MLPKVERMLQKALLDLARSLGKELGRWRPVDRARRRFPMVLAETNVGGQRLLLALLPNADLDQLTVRDREIAELLAKGFSNKEIATQLGIHSHTVADHLKRIYRALHVRSRTGVVWQLLTSGR